MENPGYTTRDRKSWFEHPPSAVVPLNQLPPLNPKQGRGVEQRQWLGAQVSASCLTHLLLGLVARTIRAITSTTITTPSTKTMVVMLSRLGTVSGAQAVVDSKV
jgi:hypothetical protein